MINNSESHTVLTSKGDWFKIDDSMMENERNNKKSQNYTIVDGAVINQERISSSYRFHDRPLFTDVKKIRKITETYKRRGAVEPNVFIKLTKLLKDLSVWWSTSR